MTTDDLAAGGGSDDGSADGSGSDDGSETTPTETTPTTPTATPTGTTTPTTTTPPSVGVTVTAVSPSDAVPLAGTATVLPVSASLAACAVPAAIANDGRDDRAAIQAALTTQGCAYLPAGVYDIETPSVVAPARRAYQMLQLSGNASLFGDGSATVLHFRGSSSAQEWQGVRMTGTGPSVHDLAIDTADISNTVEQTHAIRVLGPSTDPTVYHVTFNHPQRSESGGDCIQLVGYAATPISNPRITQNQFSHCDRSGVAIHSGTSGLEISDNTFSDTGDQDIDGEGSGENFDWLITRNTFEVGAAPQGSYAIQLQGLDGARITSNVLNGRGIFAYSASNLEIDHNRITRTSSAVIEAVLEISKASSHVNVHHNTVTRTAAVGAGPVLRAVPHNAGTPDHVTISDNVIVQQATGDIINTSGIVGLNVERNQVTYTGAANTAWGVIANGTAGTYAVRTTDIAVNNNTWTGPLKAVISVGGSYAGAGTVTAIGNTASAAGLACNNITSGGKLLGPVTVSANAWASTSCGTLAK